MPQPEDFFAGNPIAFAVFGSVRSAVQAAGSVEIRTSKSQVAFRRAHGFAYLWMPSQYLGRATVPVVLSIALGRQDDSPRFKEVVHPSPKHWIHHLEISDPTCIDDEVVAWLREAAERAG